MTTAAKTPEMIDAVYFDGNGALVPTKLPPYCIKGEPTVALTTDDPFHRVRKREYEDTVRRLNALPQQVRERYIALLKAQMKCDLKEKDAKQLTHQQHEEYSALVLKHGLPPYNPHMAIAMDYLYNEARGSAKMYNVNGRPVHAALVNKPVVISFFKAGSAFGGGNFYVVQRLQRSYASACKTGNASEVERHLTKAGVDPQTAKKSVLSTLPVYSKLVH